MAKMTKDPVEDHMKLIGKILALPKPEAIKMAMVEFDMGKDEAMFWFDIQTGKATGDVIMPNVKVIAKNESGSIIVVSLLDAVADIFTPVVIYNPKSDKWSKPTYLGSSMKFVPLEIKNYHEELVAPQEIIDGLKNYLDVIESRSRRR
jgi:hypothetical protein